MHRAQARLERDKLHSDITGWATELGWSQGMIPGPILQAELCVH